MNNFTKIEKYAIIKILLCIMKADGIVHPKEEEFMNKIYSNFAITIKELENISNIDGIEANHIVRGMTNEKKAKSKVNMGIVTETYCFLNKNIDIDEYVNTHSRNKKEIEIINHIFN